MTERLFMWQIITGGLLVFPILYAQNAPTIPLKQSSPPETTPALEVPAPTPMPLSIRLFLADEALKVSLVYHQAPPPHAVFFHNNAWWIVVSGAYTVELPTVLKPEKTRLESMDVHSTSDYTIIFIRSSIPFSATPSMEEGRFVITFKKAMETRPNPLPDTCMPTATRSTFHIPITAAERLIPITWDGEDYLIATANLANKSVYDGKDFPDFQVIRALQGGAIYWKKDDLTAKLEQNSISISGNLSETTHEQFFQARPAFPIGSLFEGFDPLTAQERRAELEKQIKDVLVENSIPEHVELAWIHLGFGNGPEAFSILQGLLHERPWLARVAFIKGLVGIAQTLCYRYDDASDTLKPFAYQPEAKAIYALAQSFDTDSKDPEFYMAQLRPLSGVLMNLPENLSEKFLDMVLTAALTNKNYEVLELYTKKDFKPKNPYYLALFELSSIAVAIHQKNPDAEKRLKKLLKNKHSPQVATMAEFEWIQYRLLKQKIKPKNAIKRLESLRFAWRGDDLEYRITKFLASLYWSQKQFYKALLLYRKMEDYFPLQTTQDQTADLFPEGVRLYFTQSPPPPLMESLSFFQEFGDYAPNTTEGDELMIAGTKRLADIGLFTEAARILKKYFDKKVTISADQPERAARLIYQIASYYAQDRDLQKTVKILQMIKTWPPTYGVKATDLLARAYLGLDQEEAALTTVGDDPAHSYLKGTIYFNQKKWDQSAEAYEKALSTPLPDAQKSETIVNLAICYALLHDTERLQLLKTGFSTFMEKTADKDVFNFLTSQNGQKLDEAGLTELAEAGKTTDFLKKIYGS